MNPFMRLSPCCLVAADNPVIQAVPVGFFKQLLNALRVGADNALVNSFQFSGYKYSWFCDRHAFLTIILP